MWCVILQYNFFFDFQMEPQPSSKIDLRKINTISKKLGKPIKVVGIPVQVPLTRPDNSELPPMPLNTGDNNDQNLEFNPTPTKLIKLNSSKTQPSTTLSPDNRALAISQAKTQQAGSVVEIVDKHGNVVGTKIVVGKKNRVKSPKKQ